MLTAALTTLLAGALAGFDGTAADLQVSGRAETSARVFVREGSTRELLATDVLPRLTLRLDRKILRGEAGYEPQLRLSRDPALPAADASLAHGGFARAEWDLDPLWRVSAAARGSVRLVDVVSASTGEAARLLELRAPDTTVRHRELAASAGVEGRPTRLLTVTSTLAASDSGGLGEAGRAAVPGMRELRAAAGVAREHTRKDVLRLDLALAAADFDLGGTASLATAGAGWARQATPGLRLRLAASASRAREEGAADRVIPGGEAELGALAALAGRPLRAAAAVRAGPALDRFAAGVQERLGADAALTWEATPRWSVSALGAAGRVREARGYSAARGELRGAWRATRRVTLGAGLWSEWHRDPRLEAAVTSAYWGTSLGVELAPEAR